MKVSFFLARPKAETETSICARIFYKGAPAKNGVKWYTHKSINPKFWDSKLKESKRGKGFASEEAKAFNRELIKIKLEIHKIFDRWIDDHGGKVPTPETLKNLLNTRFNKQTGNEKITSFIPYYEDFVNRTKAGNRVNPKSKTQITHAVGKGHGTTLAHLVNFQKSYVRKIDFDSIDYNFYLDFVEYLTYKVKQKKNNVIGLSNNTIGDHIKRLKVVLNEATERGVNNNLAYRSRAWVKFKEPSDSIYLTPLEVDQMAALNLSENSALETDRDAFVIRCYNGLRFGDSQKIESENIISDRIVITQSKTGKQVVIPIHPKVKEILKRYNGQFPKSKDNVQTNRNLKKIAEKIPSLHDIQFITRTTGGKRESKPFPKWQLVTTHTARRTFATNEYLAGDLPIITIMALTGHKTEKVFLEYIKATPDQHAEIVEIAWKKRQSQLKAV